MNDERNDDTRRAASDDDASMEVVPSPFGALLKRTAAVVYDALLLVAVLFVVTAAALPLNDGEAFGPLYLVAVFLVGWLFFDWFWRHGGQTLGMQAWRLKLVDEGDGPLTRTRTFARYALGLLLFGVTYATVPFDERRRALHDRLTRTRVIGVPKRGADARRPGI